MGVGPRGSYTDRKDWSKEKIETCSMLKTSAGDTGNWNENDLKESGIKTREKLRGFAGVNKN